MKKSKGILVSIGYYLVWRGWEFAKFPDTVVYSKNGKTLVVIRDCESEVFDEEIEKIFIKLAKIEKRSLISVVIDVLLGEDD